MAKISGSTAKFLEEYRQHWEPRLTSDYWDEMARRFPLGEAIVDASERLSWGEVQRRADRLALALLGLGVGRDEVVVSQLPNSSDFIVVRLALLKAGIMNCQPAMTLRAKEMEHILERTRAVGVIIPWEFRGFNYYEMIRAMRPRLPHLKFILVAGKEAPADAMSLPAIYARAPVEDGIAGYPDGTIYSYDEVTHIAATSGTTGVPKLVNQSDAAIKLSAKDTIARVGLTGDDVIALIAPVSGGAANVLAFYCAPICGSRIVLSETFDPAELFALIEKERPTVACSVPTVLVRMLNHPAFGRHDLSSLRVVFYYGSPISYQTAREVEEKLDCCLISRYGAFDIAAVSCASVHDDGEVRLQTAGKPYTGCEIMLCGDDGSEAVPGQEGDIWVKGPTAMHGFYRDEAADGAVWNAQGKEGWGSTGDRGRFDAAGNLVIVGRKKGAIIRGGQNIYPREIEDLLRTHAKVADVAVVGMPDRVMGERVCAFVVTRQEQPLQLEEIAVFCREKLIAPFKIPERIEILERLPLVSGQKVDYRLLEEEIAGKLRDEGKM